MPERHDIPDVDDHLLRTDPDLWNRVNEVRRQVREAVTKSSERWCVVVVRGDYATFRIVWREMDLFGWYCTEVSVADASCETEVRVVLMSPVVQDLTASEPSGAMVAAANELRSET